MEARCDCDFVVVVVRGVDGGLERREGPRARRPESLCCDRSEGRRVVERLVVVGIHDRGRVFARVVVVVVFVEMV